MDFDMAKANQIIQFGSNKKDKYQHNQESNSPRIALMA